MHHLIREGFHKGWTWLSLQPTHRATNTCWASCRRRLFVTLIISFYSEPRAPPFLQWQPANFKCPPGTPGLAGWWPGKGTGLGRQSFPQEFAGHWEDYMSAQRGVWHPGGSQKILAPFLFPDRDRYQARKQVSANHPCVVHFKHTTPTLHLQFPCSETWTRSKFTIWNL